MRGAQRQYVCAECGGSLRKEGTGLGTWTCQAHPFRTVTVTKDLSAGKEASHNLREVGVQVRRHTKVSVSR